MSDPSVFAVPIFDRWLVYAPLHGVASVINGPALRQLREGAPKSEKLRQLAAMLAVEVAPPARKSGGVQPIFLGLIPSRLCNLHCVYCNFGVGGSAPKDRMDPAVLVEAIDWVAQNVVDTGGDTLALHFFGGEPFVEWDLVEIATHRARMAAASRNLKVHLEASSNGVYSEERARFIGDYFQGMVLSFDGFADVHDKHRPHANGRGSFDEVVRTARIFSEYPIELCLRICVTAQNVETLPEVIRWFCTEFRPSIIDFETITETDLGAQAGLAPPDPFRFASRFHECRSIAESYGVVANYSADLQSKPRTSFCPVGQDALILTPDRRLSACYLLEEDWKERGLDMVLGRLEAGQGIQLNQEAVDRARNLPLPDRCHRCLARWSCAGGCKVNHSYPGCDDELNDFCVQTRLVMVGTLLKQMGQAGLADGLLNDETASRNLALQSSDVLNPVEVCV